MLLLMCAACAPTFACLCRVTHAASPPCLHLAPSTQPGTHTGAFNRALGASGFALVNVANVPIILGRWVVGNDPANRWGW